MIHECVRRSVAGRQHREVSIQIIWTIYSKARKTMSYNILIVDDSKTMRQVIKKALSLSGFQVGNCLEASNGKEALEVLGDSWVDLILSDIHMPVMDGFGLLQALKEDENWHDLPVVIITTEANEQRLQEVMSLGAKGYIRKPFTPENIRSFLSRVMGDKDEATIPENNEGCDF
jgi:two-component system, chemotaxis family, chemotaxis protein CheY